MIIYNCTTCNKNYKTRGGLWKHNKTNHNITNNVIPIVTNTTDIICNNNIIVETTNDKNICDICNVYSAKNARSMAKHKQTCMKKKAI